MDYNKKAHSVYLLTYHIVFVTKYRRPVITDEIGDFMVNHAGYLCSRFDGEMLSGETRQTETICTCWYPCLRMLHLPGSSAH